MGQVLVVGVATLDFVFELDHYPGEDEEMRAQGLRVVRGGNAANTAVVLAQLGHRASFAGVLADNAQSAPIVADLEYFGVDVDACARHPGQPPTSAVLVTPGGSRTIVHYRDLPEFAAADFARVALDGLDWVHFEGRNVAALIEMIARVRALAPSMPVSIEAEKPRAGLEAVLPRADVLLSGRALARHAGVQDPVAFLHRLRAHAPAAEIYLGWGEGGAYAMDRNGAVHHSPAYPPPRVIDCVGAGDTFNAAVIDAKLRGLTAAQALAHGCRMAGLKCGRRGFALGRVATGTDDAFGPGDDGP